MSCNKWGLTQVLIHYKNFFLKQNEREKKKYLRKSSGMKLSINRTSHGIYMVKSSTEEINSDIKFLRQDSRVTRTSHMNGVSHSN